MSQASWWSGRPLEVFTPMTQDAWWSGSPLQVCTLVTQAPVPPSQSWVVRPWGYSVLPRGPGWMVRWGAPGGAHTVTQAGYSRWLPVPFLPRAGQWMETGTSGQAGAPAPPAAPRAGSSALASATGLHTGAPNARATGWRLETAFSSSAQVSTVPWGLRGRGHLVGMWGGQWDSGGCCRGGGGGLLFSFAPS